MYPKISNQGGLVLDISINGNQPALFLEKLAEVQETIPHTRVKITNKVDFFRIRIFDNYGILISRDGYLSFRNYINDNALIQ